MLFVGLWSGGIAAQGNEAPPPKSAARLVAAVHAAASSGAPETLRKFMTPDFVSSFGGDGGPDEAIALWSQDRSYLKHLARSTAGQCQLQTADYLECPRRAGIGYRAGFKLVDRNWVFASFVAGD